MGRKTRFAFVEESTAEEMPAVITVRGGLIDRFDRAVLSLSRKGDHRRAQDIHTASLRLGELRNVLSEAKVSAPDDLATDIDQLIALI